MDPGDFRLDKLQLIFANEYGDNLLKNKNPSKSLERAPVTSSLVNVINLLNAARIFYNVY